VIKLLHLITDLDVGGAEMMLLKLLLLTDRSLFDVRVISMMTPGPLGRRIEAAGIPVASLGMRRGVPNPVAAWRLTRMVREWRPHVIQTWMYHADLLGGLCAAAAGRVPTVWGIRHTNMEPHLNKRLTIHSAMLCARLSRWLPMRIVVCAEASRRVHAGMGYDDRKMVVIPNGFDCAVFRPQPEARHSLRHELGLPDETVIVGLVSRFHPQKDHRTFVRAAGVLHAMNPAVHFVLCGRKVDSQNAELAGWIREAGVGSVVHLLGARDDMPRITAAFDIAASSSQGEAFPNVIGEAMASGVPCVATNVGDSARIIGDLGIVVDPGDADAMAAGFNELIRRGATYRRQLGLAARRHIETQFPIALTVERYQGLYEQLVAQRPARLYHPARR